MKTIEALVKQQQNLNPATGTGTGSANFDQELDTLRKQFEAQSIGQKRTIDDLEKKLSAALEKVDNLEKAQQDGPKINPVPAININYVRKH